MMARSWWGCIVMTRTWWRGSIMKTRKWWVWWLLWQEHIVMHLIPLSLAHRQQWVRGLQWCRLSRQHQSLLQPKYSIFSNFINFEYVQCFYAPVKCPPCLGPWPPRGAEGLRWHHQMTQTFKFWNCQAKDKRFHSLLPVVLFVIFTLLSPHISHHWRELHRFYYASNSFEQSIWRYRHFWALEFVSTKDTKKHQSCTRRTRFPLTCQFFWRQLLYRQVQSCMQCSLPTIH